LDHLLVTGIVLGASIHGITGIMVGDTIAGIPGIPGIDHGDGTVGIVVLIMAGVITFIMVMYFTAIIGMGTIIGIIMDGTIGIMDMNPVINLMAAEKVDHLPPL